MVKESNKGRIGPVESDCPLTVSWMTFSLQLEELIVTGSWPMDEIFELGQCVGNK